jgi:hypothetical protein
MIQILIYPGYLQDRTTQGFVKVENGWQGLVRNGKTTNWKCKSRVMSIRIVKIGLGGRSVSHIKRKPVITAAMTGVSGGEGIRTLDTLSSIHTFQACQFNHSCTPPWVDPGGPKTARRAAKIGYFPCLRNIFSALAVVMDATSSGLRPLILARVSTT